MKIFILLSAPKQDMPEPVLTAIFFDDFKHLEFPAEQFYNIASGEIASIGSLGDMPVFPTAAEKRKFRAENRKDKKALWGRKRLERSAMIIAMVFHGFQQLHNKVHGS